MALDFPSTPTTGQSYTPTNGPTYVWDGTVWKVAAPGSSFNRTVFTATAGQTSFTVSYVVGTIDVFRNGVKLVSGTDYTATNGSTVVLTDACTVNDTVETFSYSQVQFANAIKKTGDTMTGDLTVQSNTFLATTSGKIGVGTTSPGFKLEIVGGTNDGVHIKDAATPTVYGGLFTQGGSLGLIARSNHALNFGTSDAERARIDANGNFMTGGKTSTSWNGSFFGSSFSSSATQITLAAGASVTLSSSVCGAALVCVYVEGSGNGGLYFLNYSSAASRIQGDGSNADSGSDFAVFKSAGSHTSTLKNRAAVTQIFTVTILAGRLI